MAKKINEEMYEANVMNNENNENENQCGNIIS
jgi:hypothetical protein